MSYQRTDNGPQTTILLQGTLDAKTAPEHRPLVDALVAEKRQDITLDMGGLRQLDSTGVGVIVSLYKRVTADGGLVKIINVQGQPLAMFRLLRLDRVFHI